MTDIEKVIKGLECCRIDENRHINCADCPYYTDDDKGQMWCSNEINNDAIELLKGYIELKEQLEELQIIENSRVKDCDDACDWEARDYHKGRFDAYSIALAHFDRKDGEQKC